ncbi:acyl carrier protein [Uniformispora flossi]|uniref:Acyl carrier protein n=1 Tax=Yinghuangia aomiensis TaxID=676205 RepID=A0ABP9HD09_9ACTN
MNGPFTYSELADLMKASAGISADPMEMEIRPEAEFGEFGLDSLGLIAVVSELEQRYGLPLGQDAEACKSPAQLVEFVNAQITSGV